MTRLILIRHGYSCGNKEKRFSGQIDLPLDDEGYQQAEQASQYILEHFKVDTIYASDLCRAVDTVKPIADALGLPIHAQKELREINEGIWQGMRQEDVKQQFPEQYAFYKANLGLMQFIEGECYATMLDRLLPAIQTIIKENDGKTVVIGTHGGVIRGLLSVWLGVPLERVLDVPRVPNGTITVVECEGDDAKVVTLGYSEHLERRTGENGAD